ncbi:MAG: leucine-rich repeat protein [Clostridia bacterium]|nr:leucine-rich repeat protein [Clostridia bacterium]
MFIKPYYGAYHVGYAAFFECSSLTESVIPNRVTSIGGMAFYGCSNLTVLCNEGSYADTYAKENGMPIEYN